MSKPFKGIRVVDKNGVPFAVFQVKITDTIHGHPRTVLRFELAGQVGDFVDADTFVVKETGERFSVIANGEDPVSERPDRRWKQSHEH